jgi:hypothetical protein
MPELANVNLNAVKTLRIPWLTLEIRGAIFNLFNRLNLNQPTADFVEWFIW